MTDTPETVIKLLTPSRNGHVPPPVSISVGPERVELVLPVEGGLVAFEFADITTRPGRFDADVTVKPNIIGVSEQEFNAHLQLKSLSNLEQFRRALDSNYGKDLGWAQLVNDATQRAKTAYLEAAVAEDIEHVAVSFDRRYVIDGLIPEDGTTIFFGQGSTAKTYTTLAMCLSMNAGTPFLGRHTARAPVLLLDCEATREAIARRRHRLILGGDYGYIPDQMFHYMPGRGIPVVDLIPSIKRELARTKATVLVVDSAVSGLGANPMDPEPVGRMMASLNALGVTVILIAHVTKEGGDEYPFGSIFWHNLARMTWNVKRVDSEDSADIQVGFFNRKANDDRRQKAFGATLRFDDPEGPVTVEPCDLADVPDLARGLGLPQRILATVSKGPRTTGQLAEDCAARTDSIRQACNRLAAKGLLYGRAIPGENEKTWHLVTDRAQEAR